MALERVLSRHRLEKADRSLATELVYGTCRRLNTLDWAVDQVASRPVKCLDSWIRDILRMTAYQLMILTRIPQRAAIHQAVELAKKYGHAGSAGFVNGVLRALSQKLDHLRLPDERKEPVRHLALKYSHPEWIVARWLSRYGCEETAKLCEANNATPPVSIRVNRLKISREAYQNRLAASGIEARFGLFHPQCLLVSGASAVAGLPGFGDGLFTVQDESSMLASQALSPQPGATVLDACAGRGGKSTHLAELMGDRGEIVSCDIHPHKLDRLRETCSRLGLESVRPLAADSRELPGLLGERFDYVLADVPCSGLGVLRRHPEARWRQTPEQLRELPKLQADILRAAARCLKPGGVLVYSTCSIEPEENEQVVNAFLEDEAEFFPESLWPYLPVSLWRENGADSGQLQITPHLHKSDGFFISRLKRRDRM